MELMEDYPEARKFYMERAWQRRIEFRRRQKAFIKALEELDSDDCNKVKNSKNQSSDTQTDSSLLSEESIKSDDEILK